MPTDEPDAAREPPLATGLGRHGSDCRGLSGRTRCPQQPGPQPEGLAADAEQMPNLALLPLALLSRLFLPLPLVRFVGRQRRAGESQ